MLPAGEETILRAEKRMDVNDPLAYYPCGRRCYRDGRWGRQVDDLKALELFHRAAELGLPEAYVLKLAHIMSEGNIVNKDPAKARACFAIAAMKGSHFCQALILVCLSTIMAIPISLSAIGACLRRQGTRTHWTDSESSWGKVK